MDEKVAGTDTPTLISTTAYAPEVGAVSNFLISASVAHSFIATDFVITT